ncbi:molybdopterin synthase sulfur carrier subunit [Amycolatopsis sp. WAC 01376]|uniref:MoaD/ThiS family protein n=1 Tax=Amycolatopsis sp. WAC 01376 TaxID=2203195 RepID=UPI000F7817B4|nr:MoaD/ThiS family protein [Amycolatopsis sp. WAC 01376]RSM66994.1 molybdopterin synthase sulfur carrier subunit [Amycolatopsis sp. WAC 01376]
MVRVLLPAMLRPLAGDEGALEVVAPTLDAVLDSLGVEYPALERRLRDETGVLRRYVNFYVDGEECRRLDGAKTSLADAKEVQIIPSVAGG